MTRENLTEILTAALSLGIIDIFTVITYQVNGVPSDEIVAELTGKVQAQKAVCTPVPA